MCSRQMIRETYTIRSNHSPLLMERPTLTEAQSTARILLGSTPSRPKPNVPFYTNRRFESEGRSLDKRTKSFAPQDLVDLKHLIHVVK